MTDLPEDDKQTQRQQRAFNQLVALKAQKQTHQATLAPGDEHPS